MLSFKEINIIGNLINTNFGMSSTEPGDFPLGTAPVYSVTAQLVGDTQPEGDEVGQSLLIKYVTIVTYGSHEEILAQERKFRKESEMIIGQKINNLKDGFKEIAGRPLKCIHKYSDVSNEIIYPGFNQPGCRNWSRAYYRCNCVYQIS